MSDIVLPALPAPVDQLWHVLLDLGEQLQVPWTLVGGQMVLLHALENDAVPPQISQDGDVLADIRAQQDGLVEVVRILEAQRFSLESISADGIAHRYVRHTDAGRLVVDVLAPDGVGERANLTTTPPGRTIEVPGGSQAMSRTEWVRVSHEGRSGRIPRPTLLGAVVIKSAAVALPSPARHLRDLAHEAWQLVPSAIRGPGQIAFDVLLNG